MTDGAYAIALGIYSLQILVVVGLAAAAERLLPLRAPGARLVYWRGVLVCCLLLPMAVLFPSTGRSTDSGVIAMVSVDRDRGARVMPPAIAGVLPALVVFGAGARVLWLGFGMWRLRRLRMSALPVDDPAMLAVRDVIAPAADLRTHGAVVQPMTFGWRRPMVLFPPRFRELSAETRRAVACHELLHIARRDWPWILGEEWLRSVFWFHPAVWWALAQIELSREQAVDEAVVRYTGSRAAYMRALVAYAVERPSVRPALTIGRRHHLMARLRNLANDRPVSPVRTAATALALAAVVGAGTMATAAVLPLRFEAAILGRDAPSALYRERGLAGANRSAPRVLREVKPAYTADALRAKVEGAVLLEVVISSDGSVADARVVQSIPLLDEAALDAARQWQFEPALVDGIAASATVTLSFHFTLR